MSILHLKDWDVTEVHNNARDYVIDATFTGVPVACVNCGVVGKLYKHGTRPQQIADTPIHGKKTVINLTRVRYRCQACGKTFLQPLTDVADTGTMTQRLVSYIETQSFRRTFTGIAEDVGVAEGTIRNVFDAYVTFLDQTVVFETPEVLGIDETHLLRQPRLVLTNIEKGTFIDVLETRNKPAVHERLFWMPTKERVRLVAMDMWRPYRDAVKVILPGAQIVIDKFHVVRMANQSLEAVRKSLRADMNTGERRHLMRSRHLLLWRRKTLRPDQQKQLEEWSQAMPLLGAAYKAKEDFFDMYDQSGDRDTALTLYDIWKSNLPTELAGVFKPLTTAMKNWEDEVFAYFDNRVTNAVTEALNGVAKSLNKTGRGYSFKVIRARMLYAKGMQHPKERPMESAIPSTPFVEAEAIDVRPLTREEVVALRQSFGVSVAELAKVLEMPATISRWQRHLTRVKSMANKRKS